MELGQRHFNSEVYRRIERLIESNKSNLWLWMHCSLSHHREYIMTKGWIYFKFSNKVSKDTKIIIKQKLSIFT